MPSHYKGTEQERRALDLLIKLTRATEAFLGRLYPTVNAAGLTPSQFGVLESLYHLGPLTPTQVAQKHLRSKNNLSLVFSHLERDGLICREPHKSDQRAHILHLTDKGRAVMEKAMPRFIEKLVAETSVLTAEEQELLSDLLRKLGKGTGPSLAG